MISVEQLTVEFGGSPLFDNVGFLVNRKEKVALVGKNGAGKTTLLRIVAGLQQPTGGRVTLPRDAGIGYLPQTMIHNEGTTVMQETEKAFEHITDLKNKIDDLNVELAARTDYESADYHNIIEQITEISEYYHTIENNNFVAEIEKTLLGLGFMRSDFDRPCAEFSGGWRMRIELAKILLQHPDILLLDEPTNHLDIESIQWLENFLIASNAALLLVSHDRAFLNAVTTRTVEISLGKIYDYNVNYSKYVELRKERREQQIRAYENQQKLIADTEEFIERFRYKATKAVQVQSRIKQLKKLERLEVDLEDNSRLNLKFPPAPRSGTIPVEIENLTKKYGQKTILENIGLIINRGEKVAFAGKNGEGKTTLVKCLMGQTDFTGKLKLGHNVKIGYFAQNQASLLDENLTVFETVDYAAVGEIRNKIRDILGAFMFGGQASDKKVKVLSGGERSRLAMIRLLLEPVNLLILDEPTNHLDMRSKDVLKEAICAFDGTAIIVSHDRNFLDGLATKVYEFGNKKVREHLGGIYEFLQHKKIENLNELEHTAFVDAQSIAPLQTQPQKTVSENKLNYEQRKEHAKSMRRAERDVQEKEKEISDLETQIAEFNQKLNIPKNASNPDFILQYQKTQRELEHALYEWEILSAEVEKLQTTISR
ncbi:MAG: ABC-F family ATP-binding cassette domain-containing protein [Prevotellaceae bacterium]|jgi:ATP-binding cassette subfamily F protein 3|nr:ABC-F family ATP-binding cassette domain-containing protein [Prevotellaceae bacterium]